MAFYVFGVDENDDQPKVAGPFSVYAEAYDWAENEWVGDPWFVQRVSEVNEMALRQFVTHNMRGKEYA